MGIRKATIEDLELVITMSYNFLETTNYLKFTDGEKFGQLIASFLIGDPARTVLLYDNIGMIAGIINPFLFGKDLVATEMAWWVEPEYRNKKIGLELITAFEKWAKEEGCKMITLVSLDDEISKFYEKANFKLYERAYFKEI